jgi:hypothetical protein
MKKNYSQFIIAVILLMAIDNAYSQTKAVKKYPSLFWEITGNGLKKALLSFWYHACEQQDGISPE